MSNKEIEVAKYHFEKARQDITDYVLSCIPRADRNKSWDALYYYSPAAKFAAKGFTDRSNEFVAHFPACGDRLNSLVAGVTQRANELLALQEKKKAAKLAPKAPVSMDSCAFSTASTPVPPSSISVGEILLLAYGNGTQAAVVDSFTGPKGMKIRRLNSRGTKFACWMDSSISRFDRRILGVTKLCAFDPKP